MEHLIPNWFRKSPFIYRKKKNMKKPIMDIHDYL